MFSNIIINLKANKILGYFDMVKSNSIKSEPSSDDILEVLGLIPKTALGSLLLPNKHN